MLSRSEIQKIPKVEFHRHLDGSVRFDTLVDIARKKNLDLGLPLEDKKGLWAKTKIVTPMDSLEQVLDSFWTTQKVMCDVETISRIAYENVEDCFLDGLVLSELRFAPVFMAHQKKISLEDCFEGVLDGVNRAQKKFGIAVGVIHICPRSLDMKENQKSAKLCADYKKNHDLGKRFLVGADLADLESTTKHEDFVPLIEIQREAGLGVTIHSGEDTSGDHVIKALDYYRPTRIGHGIKIWNHQKAMERVIRDNIHLEVCPTSNWLTHCVSNIEDHPLYNLYQAGVNVSLNSDDPHIMNIDLVHEYEVAMRFLGLGQSELYNMNKKALDFSFLDKNEVTKIKEKYFHE